MGIIVLRTPDDGDAPDKPTHVYVMRCEGHCKIGIAVSVEQRGKNLQSCCPYPISIEAKLLLPSFMEAKRIERELHAAFGAVRGFGEWFSVSPVEVMRLLSTYEPLAYVPPAAPPATVRLPPDTTRLDIEASEELGYDFPAMRRASKSLEF